jgi:NYN domain
MADPVRADFAPRPRVALLVDGDNLSHSHAGALIVKSAPHGALTIKRVYGNMATHPGWQAAPGFRCIHSGTGKNASDLLLAIEATSLMLSQQADVLIIASSDGDFSHLAHHLTERGHQVIGLGEAKTPMHFQKSCSRFHLIGTPPPRKPDPPQVQLDQLVQKARDLVAAEPEGMPITLLSTRMSKDNAVQISLTPHRTWRAFLTSHSAIFTCDPKGPDARVRLKA